MMDTSFAAELSASGARMIHTVSRKNPHAGQKARRQIKATTATVTMSMPVMM